METRKKITLPSGSTVVVRALKSFDYSMAGSKFVPIILEIQKRRRNNTQSQHPVSQVEDEFASLTALLSLTKATSPITRPDGVRFRIVAKEMDELEDGEISIGELADEDIAMIISEVQKLTGMGKEAAVAASTFPEQQAGDVGAASPGEDLRQNAE